MTLRVKRVVLDTAARCRLSPRKRRTCARQGGSDIHQLFHFCDQMKRPLVRAPSQSQHENARQRRAAQAVRRLKRSPAEATSQRTAEFRTARLSWATCRRSVSQPRSSNRTCPFRASGFPTDFISGSRQRRQMDCANAALRTSRILPHPDIAQPRATVPCVAESGTTEPAYRRDDRRPDMPSAACPDGSMPPSLAIPVERVADFLPWLHVAGFQQLAHFGFEP